MLAKKVYVNRVNSLFSRIEEDIDALIITSSHNSFYFTGFDNSIVTVLFKEEEPIAIVPRLEFLRAKDSIMYGKVYAVNPYMVDFGDYEKVFVGKAWDLIKKIFEECGVEGRIGIDKAELKADSYAELLKTLDAELVDVTKIIANLRAVKTEEEVKIIEKSISIAEKAMEKAIENLDRGVTESEIAAEIDRILRVNFSDRSFDPIVAFGENSAYPHAKPRDRKLKKGDLVIIDLGAKYHGYCSDLTRTFVYGEPSEKQRRYYDIVLKAQKNAIEHVREGVEAKEIDMKAREVLKKEGLSQYFNHGLGHGVGIEIHETPYLNPASREVLREGMIITIEPGIYIGGYGGVRIEDMILVRKDECRVLTSFEKFL